MARHIEPAPIGVPNAYSQHNQPKTVNKPRKLCSIRRCVAHATKKRVVYLSICIANYIPSSLFLLLSHANKAHFLWGVLISLDARFMETHILCSAPIKMKRTRGNTHRLIEITHFLINSTLAEAIQITPYSITEEKMKGKRRRLCVFRWCVCVCALNECSACGILRCREKIGSRRMAIAGEKPHTDKVKLGNN